MHGTQPGLRQADAREEGGIGHPCPSGARLFTRPARKRGENTMPQKLAGELLEASESRGGAVKKREETHRMAEANKAFSHFRW